MNEFTKENICPQCNKELVKEMIDVDYIPSECFICYPCGIISSPFSIYKVKDNE